MMSKRLKGRDMRKRRLSAKVKGTTSRPRVSVFRSARGFYVQFIDDDKRMTLLGSNTNQVKLTQTISLKRLHEFGKLIAEMAKKKGIQTVVFDRSGYAYHGKVKSFVEGLREGGLKV